MNRLMNHFSHAPAAIVEPRIRHASSRTNPPRRSAAGRCFGLALTTGTVDDHLSV